MPHKRTILSIGKLFLAAGFSPRVEASGIEALKTSILKRGILSELTVTPVSPNHYQIIDGTRRFIALKQLAQLAQAPDAAFAKLGTGADMATLLKEIPVCIVSGTQPADNLELSVLCNTPAAYTHAEVATQLVKAKSNLHSNINPNIEKNADETSVDADAHKLGAAFPFTTKDKADIETLLGATPAMLAAANQGAVTTQVLLAALRGCESSKTNLSHAVQQCFPETSAGEHLQHPALPNIPSTAQSLPTPAPLRPENTDSSANTASSANESITPLRQKELDVLLGKLKDDATLPQLKVLHEMSRQNPQHLLHRARVEGIGIALSHIAGLLSLEDALEHLKAGDSKED